MSGYVIVDIEVTDPTAYAEYRQLVPPVVAKFGGNYLVRGGNFEKIEGDWTLTRLVVLEFENLEKAKQFYYSPEYEPLKQLRLKSTNSNMVMVEGA